jgi:hypothetical protein
MKETTAEQRRYGRLRALLDPDDEALVERVAGRLDLIDLTWQRVTREVWDDGSTPPYLATSMVQRDVPDIVRAILTALREEAAT